VAGFLVVRLLLWTTQVCLPGGRPGRPAARTLIRMPIIEVRGLTKRFGPLLAVDNLSFTVSRGTVTGFLGRNGAGKTTTLRMLLGLVGPSSGTALIDGRPYQSLPSPAGAVGTVLESSGYYPGRTARDHLRIQALATGTDPRRIDEVLDLVDLGHVAGRRIGTFSLGMRQRLGLATALLPSPPVLILDEPANGLDPDGIRWMRQLLRGFAASGGTVLMSSHILAEAEQTIDWVLILDHGRLVADDSLASLTQSGGLEETFLKLTEGSPS
jgi:ABC-2 type transport system ATP-binding protein